MCSSLLFTSEYLIQTFHSPTDFKQIVIRSVYDMEDRKMLAAVLGLLYSWSIQLPSFQAFLLAAPKSGLLCGKN